MPTGIRNPYPLLSSLLHLQRRCIPSRHERSLLAKEWTIFRNLSSKSVIFGRTRFLYMPQSWDMGQIILLPLWRKAFCAFFQLEKSDGFGRERTCDLGYQRPACKPLDHQSHFPTMVTLNCLDVMSAACAWINIFTCSCTLILWHYVCDSYISDFTELTALILAP
jgi:hypothetical protein